MRLCFTVDLTFNIVDVYISYTKLIKLISHHFFTIICRLLFAGRDFRILSLRKIQNLVRNSNVLRVV
jgi:hypothetical protein